MKYNVWIAGYRSASRIGRLPITFGNYEEYLHHSKFEFECIRYLFNPPADYVVIEDTFESHPRAIYIPLNY